MTPQELWDRVPKHKNYALARDVAKILGCNYNSKFFPLLARISKRSPESVDFLFEQPDRRRKLTPEDRALISERGFYRILLIQRKYDAHTFFIDHYMRTRRAVC